MSPNWPSCREMARALSARTHRTDMRLPNGGNAGGKGANNKWVSLQHRGFDHSGSSNYDQAWRLE